MAVALACSAIGALRAGYGALGASAPSPLRGGSPSCKGSRWIPCD